MVLRQDQRQTISQRIDPKLIMANAILQKSTLELDETIEVELAENPALEAIDREPVCPGTCIDPLACPDCSRRRALREADDLPVGAEGADDGRFRPDYGPRDNTYDEMATIEAEVTLQDHLRSQLRAAVTEADYRIGDYIVDSLDDNGLLGMTIEEIAAELKVDVADATRVLRVVQSLDPPGVGARDVRECMLIQLRSLREEGRGNGLAETMLETHFDEVVRSRYGKLARAMGVTVDKAKETIDFMRQCLNPYPANQFRPPWVGKARNSKAAVRPDVAIHRTSVGYEIEILGGESSVLGVNEKYRETYDAIQRGDTSLSEEERKHIVEYVERAELFIQHLKQRRRTLKQITRCIAEMQQGFLDTGSRAYLIPLTRTHIAETLGIHESTVSRATAKKYVQLPNEEVVPFDLFFNGSVSIKSEIEKIIAAEDPAHPVSDQRIVEILAERGISVARRTVVKYREGLKILSSTRRRR